MTTPPIRMYAWFIRSPVIVSKMSIRILALAEAVEHDATAPSSRPPVASHTRWDAIRFSSQHEHADHLRARRRLDAEQPLDRQAVRRAR